MFIIDGSNSNAYREQVYGVEEAGKQSAAEGVYADDEAEETQYPGYQHAVADAVYEAHGCAAEMV